MHASKKAQYEPQEDIQWKHLSPPKKNTELISFHDGGATTRKHKHPPLRPFTPAVFFFFPTLLSFLSLSLCLSFASLLPVATMRASHILVKHQGSRRTASWKDVDGVVIKTRTKVSRNVVPPQERAMCFFFFVLSPDMTVGYQVGRVFVLFSLRKPAHQAALSGLQLRVFTTCPSRALFPLCTFARKLFVQTSGVFFVFCDRRGYHPRLSLSDAYISCSVSRE